jgi:hypothetical protein
MTIFGDITQWKFLPIHRLVLYDLTTDSRVEFLNAEQDSSYKMDPITRTSMYGETRTLAWKFECTFVPLQTNINEMTTALRPLINTRVTGYLELRALAGQLNGSLGYIPLGDGMSVTWSMANGELRPRLSIVVAAILTTPEITDTEPVI